MKTFSARTNYRLSFLGEIFNQDSAGNNTITSTYYQNIIHYYFLKDVNSYFTLRDIVNDIIPLLPLRTRKEKKDHNITEQKSYIVGDREKTFRKYFSNMVSWGILSNKQIPVKKGTGHTFEYAITKFGKLLALLIETDFNTSKSAFDLLYSFLELYFNEESYSIDYFCKSYLKKCKKAGLFVDFIRYLRKNILYQSKYISNDNDLFTSMIFMTTSDKQLNKKLWKLWNESYNEMDYDLQELFLYHLKLAIDRRIDETVVSYGGYESMLFEYKYEYHTITLEYRCLNCDCNFIFYSQIPILRYLKKLFQGIRTEKFVTSEPDESIQCIECTECNRKRMKFTII